MGVRDIVSAIFTPERYAAIPPARPLIDNYWPFINMAQGGMPFPMSETWSHQGDAESSGSAAGATYAFGTNAIVFACMAKRMKLFSEARPRYRRFAAGKPGDIWGDGTLDILNHPWPGAATGDLLARAIQDVDLVGNFYCIRRKDVLHRLRPDWVSIMLDSPDALEAQVVAYAYYPGGEMSGSRAIYLMPEEVAHFAPYPDPTARFRGMSWLTPVVREVAADSATTSHKLEFFKHAATPNMIVKRGVPAANESFTDWVKKMREASEGSQNAYKTFYMSQGADATVVGRDFQQIELRATQGAGEVRIIAASGLHPVIVGVSESLQGSSLNSGNFGAARRLTADTFLRPDWRNFFSSMETIVPPPAGSQLWYDDHDIPFLREDAADAANIQHVKASTITQLVRDGFTAESSVAAVNAEDMSLLVHTGLFSVQLQAPGSTKMPAGEVPGELPVGTGPGPAEVPAGATTTKPLTSGTNGKTPAQTPGRSELLEYLVTARAAADYQRDGEPDYLFVRYSPDQPRVPAGDPAGGQFGYAGGKAGLSYDKLTTEALAGGFSVTTHGDVPMGGYMVSPYSGAEEKFDARTMTRADVHRYRDQHAKQLSQPDHYLGGWRDGDTVYLDIAIHTDSASKAKALSEEHNQLAYFDLGKGESVYLQGAAAH
jgi:hypothetical protein